MSKEVDPNSNGAAKAADIFFKNVIGIDEAHRNSRRQHEKALSEKDAHLIPIRQLLKKLCDARVYVIDSGVYDKTRSGRAYLPPQLFKVTEDESSPKWQPGGSLYIDHPAPLEIAVVNISNRAEYGLIEISCTEEHPDRHILAGPFRTSEQACIAIAEFLSKSTLRIENPGVFEE